MWNNLTSELAIFLLCLIGYYMIYNVAAYYSQKRELELLRQKQNEVMTDLNRANQMYDEIRVLRHEFKNHVLTMQAFTRMEEYDKLRGYLDRYLKTDGKALTAIDCGNKVLNNILNYKRGDLAERGVTFEPSIRVPEELPFEEADIASLLVNLIDNAAEAALKTPSPYVTLKIFVEKNYCFVTVVNPVNTNVMAENPNLSTTKADAANHGIGLRMVRSITDKYNGYLDFDQKEDTFIVSAMLSMVMA
jgi:sensor histidine kinase regulating citrate/malate metabolism